MTFAKIITASDGEQVLFVKDNGDDGPELVQMTEVGGVTARIALGFTEDDVGYELRQKAFDKASLEQADLVRRAVKEAVGGRA